MVKQEIDLLIFCCLALVLSSCQRGQISGTVDRSSDSKQASSAPAIVSKSDPRFLKISQLVEIMNVEGKSEFSYADEDPNFMIPGETMGSIEMYQGRIWKLGASVKWDSKKKAFVMQRLPAPGANPGGLTVLYDPDVFDRNNPQPWTMIHPGIPVGTNPFSNEELEQGMRRIRVTNWIIVYPASPDKFRKQLNWITGVGYSNGLGYGVHLMYRPRMNEEGSE